MAVSTGVGGSGLGSAGGALDGVGGFEVGGAGGASLGGAGGFALGGAGGKGGGTAGGGCDAVGNSGGMAGAGGTAGGAGMGNAGAAGSAPPTCAPGAPCNCVDALEGSFVLRSDGTVWDMHQNAVVTHDGAPASDVKSIAAYFNGVTWQLCMVLADGGDSLLCDDAPIFAPDGVTPLTGMAKVFHFSGLEGGCAATAGDAKAYCWGTADFSLAWPGSKVSHVVVDASGAPLTGVTEVSVGVGFACAARVDGSLWCWGDPSVAKTLAVHEYATQWDAPPGVVDVLTESCFNSAFLCGAQGWAAICVLTSAHDVRCFPNVSIPCAPPPDPWSKRESDVVAIRYALQTDGGYGLALKGDGTVVNFELPTAVYQKSSQLGVALKIGDDLILRPGGSIDVPDAKSIPYTGLQCP